jgi:hypothetical protein
MYRASFRMAYAMFGRVKVAKNVNLLKKVQNENSAASTGPPRGNHNRHLQSSLQRYPHTFNTSNLRCNGVSPILSEPWSSGQHEYNMAMIASFLDRIRGRGRPETPVTTGSIPRLRVDPESWACWRTVSTA